VPGRGCRRPARSSPPRGPRSRNSVQGGRGGLEAPVLVDERPKLFQPRADLVSLLIQEVCRCHETSPLPAGGLTVRAYRGNCGARTLVRVCQRESSRKLDRCPGRTAGRAGPYRPGVHAPMGRAWGQPQRIGECAGSVAWTDGRLRFAAIGHPAMPGDRSKNLLDKTARTRNTRPTATSVPRCMEANGSKGTEGLTPDGPSRSRPDAAADALRRWHNTFRAMVPVGSTQTTFAPPGADSTRPRQGREV
jgi:hypothetical protein